MGWKEDELFSSFKAHFLSFIYLSLPALISGSSQFSLHYFYHLSAQFYYRLHLSKTACKLFITVLVYEGTSKRDDCAREIAHIWPCVQVNCGTIYPESIHGGNKLHWYDNTSSYNFLINLYLSTGDGNPLTPMFRLKWKFPLQHINRTFSPRVWIRTFTRLQILASSFCTHTLTHTTGK